ncbi:MAG: hypothetical protein QOH12_3209 [Solirubrobacteraceae bacterium]|nr:hypothetical protein [Solirubrobacteraceae bacterium]
MERDRVVDGAPIADSGPFAPDLVSVRRVCWSATEARRPASAAFTHR